MTENNRIFEKILSSVRAFVNAAMHIQFHQKLEILLVAELLISYL